MDLYCPQPESVPRVISDPFNVVYSKVTGSGDIYLRVSDWKVIGVEVARPSGSVDWVEADYWLVDGTKLVLKTLSPCALLVEKASANLDRRRARVLYDVYCLLDFFEGMERLRCVARWLFGVLSEPPEDYCLLDELILVGRVPSLKTVFEKVRRVAAQEVR